MASEWQELRLEKAMDAIIDYRGKTPKKTSSGIPLITAKIVKNGRINPTQEFIAEADYESWMQRGIPQKGDVVLTTEAPLGEVAQIGGEKVALAQRIITLRGKQDLLESDFLKYLLQSSYVQHQLDGRASGTTVSGIKQSELRQVVLRFPHPAEQRAIAHILGSLDDKIELNRQMNATLEGMAQALFKSWFVDFDPVIDNALAAGNPIPEELADRAEVRRAALADGTANREAAKPFPAGFQHTEDLGWIPEGWSTKSITECAEIRHGYAFKGEYFSDTETSDILVTPGNFRVGGGFKSIKMKHYRGPIDSEYELLAKDLIVTMTDLSKGGDTLGYPAFVPNSDFLRFLHNQRIGRINLKNSDVGKFYLYQLLRTNSYRNEILGSMSGSTVKHTSPSKIGAFLFSFSRSHVEKIYDDEARKIESKISQNEEQSTVLTQLRDTLLPKLISGELRIPDAGRLSEEGRP